jgi:hypothetical protein
MKNPPTVLALPALSLAAFVFGMILLFEVVRPFRDLRIDGPLAVGCWVVGLLAAGSGLWLRKGHVPLTVTALVLNALALTGVGLLFVLLSRESRLF